MRLSFRAKLLASHLALVAAVVLILALILNRAVGQDLVGQLDARLAQQARGAAEWLAEGGRHPRRLAARLMHVVDARVTFLDAAGRVVGDSGWDGVSLAEGAAQADAPEVAAARAGRVGVATRALTRPGGGTRAMHYVAVPVPVPVDRAGPERVIVRLGVPLSDVEATVAGLRRRLLLATGLGGAVALALGLLLARVAVRPLRAMTASATAIARGQYDIRLPAAAPDEFGTLARTLESLAAQLEARIGDLTAERDRLSAILASMVEGVLVLGPDGRILAANPAAAEILGAAAPLQGRTLGEVAPPPGLGALLAEAVASGRPTERESDEPARSVALSARPLASGGGVVAVLHDVTRLRRLETVRRDFVANVSHELRTPVTAIQGYAETLLGGAADAPTARQFLEVIHRHAQRIGRLVEDLLRLSELEARPPGAAAQERVPLAPVARHVADTARAAGVVVEVPADLAARGDPDAIEQVVQNLVDNAVKHGPPGGKVTVRGGRTGGARVRLSVADEGPGIGPEHLARLFERFYRVDPSRARDQGGTGLGLAIVKHLVEGMGGQVTVESAMGRGTTFTVELPEALEP